LRGVSVGGRFSAFAGRFREIGRMKLAGAGGIESATGKTERACAGDGLALLRVLDGLGWWIDVLLKEMTHADGGT
jgi:hypothetical protein